jgi:hypothetical protein
MQQGQEYDARTWLEKARDSLQAAIQGRATQDQLSYSIGGVQVSKMNLADMFKALDTIEARIRNATQQSRVESGKSPGNRVLIRFTND